ncbi:hypothetical protein SNE40_003249 [Patella caerulea]|uniref:ETS domain-containing protein n=1 Tax=Patella caerulea TaxID=87958 RepID=A0AAN8KHN4_PATCE
MEAYGLVSPHHPLTESDFLNPQFGAQELTELSSAQFREGNESPDMSTTSLTICSSYHVLNPCTPPGVISDEDLDLPHSRLLIKEEPELDEFEIGQYNIISEADMVMPTNWPIDNTISIDNDSCSNDDIYQYARTADVFNIPKPVRNLIPHVFAESESDSNDSQDSKPERKKPGRKKGQVSRVLHLWEFIRDLLKDPNYCGRIIKWEDKSHGVFRIVKSVEVANLWGEKKKNKRKMTYEKMSRSLRYSKQEGYFCAVPKEKKFPKKLCFMFGPKSKGWE